VLLCLCAFAAADLAGAEIVDARQQLATIGVDVSVERLIQYAAEGDAATVELLLSAGVSAASADPTRRVTPLHNAAAHGHVRLMQRFLDLGADVDALDWAGSSALAYAAYHGRLAAVDLLLSHKARVDAVPVQGPTVLIAAIQGGSLPIVERLLGAGSDPRLADASGQLPVEAAKTAGRTDIATRLGTAISSKVRP